MEGTGEGGYIDEFVSVDLELSSLLSSVIGRSQVNIAVDMEEEPEGGWDAWCSRVSKKGKIARILRTISKNVMSFDWSGGDEVARKKLINVTRTTHLKLKLMQAYRDWQVYGRFFIEISWEYDGNRLKLRAIKIIPPHTMKVYRDSREDIDRLKMDIPNKEGYRRYFKRMQPGAGDTIIGFVQKTNLRYNTASAQDNARRNNASVNEKDYIFFKPEELIFLPRYPDHDVPDGMSLLRENYDTIMNKLGYEKSQSIMVKRHIDPKLIFSIPREQWGDRRRIQQEIKYGIKAGMDIFIPEGMNINVLQSSGMGSGVSEAIKHTEDEFLAAMGFADSFTQSDSSNRSVGEIQMEFFERDIASEREIFTDFIMTKIVKPYVRHNLGDVEVPELKWTDIAPEDRKQNAQLVTPFINMLTLNQLLALMEDIGYPVMEKDIEEFKKNVDSARQAGMGMGATDGLGTPMGGTGDGTQQNTDWSQYGLGSQPNITGMEKNVPDSYPTPKTVTLTEESPQVDLNAKIFEAAIKKIYELEDKLLKLENKNGAEN